MNQQTPSNPNRPRRKSTLQKASEEGQISSNVAGAIGGCLMLLLIMFLILVLMSFGAAWITENMNKPIH